MMSSHAFPNQVILSIVSLCLVAFGQPLWSNWIALTAACFGFALFWRVILDISSKKDRFWMGFGWFASVQLIQLSWMASHPFFYIYAVMLICASIGGIQFGLICCFIQRSLCFQIKQIFALAGLWTIFEWTRLFILSGLSFNPVGLAFGGQIYTLQLASIGGVYLLSFLVFLINLFVLRLWIQGYSKATIAWPLILIAFPFAFGYWHYHTHGQRLAQHKERLSVLLVQTAFPIEENMKFQSADEARAFVLGEWYQILTAIGQYNKDSKVDLVVLPEFVVPYGTYYPVFPLNDVQFLFQKALGSEVLSQLAPLEDPYGTFIESKRGEEFWVSNAFLARSIANILDTDIVMGLEDSVYTNETETIAESYSAAFHFSPGKPESERYDKRVLVPMGEYIPFTWLKDLAKSYGIGGSFTPGSKAVVCNGTVPFGSCICYEETYGHIIRENRLAGAELLVNLTNDGWYPNSALPQQHFDHARLRTVENGIPLVRACNTGVTGGINSVGDVIDYFGRDPSDLQMTQGALLIEIPTYHYKTLYVFWGDYFIIGLSCFAMALGSINIFKRKPK